MSATTDKSKPATVSVTITVSYPAAKADMTFEDFAAEGKKAATIKDAYKQHGAVEGYCVIGKQRFKL